MRRRSRKSHVSQGSAKRTDSWIIEETPSPVERSLPIMATMMAIDIEPEMSEKRCHPLKVFFFKNLSEP
jgi:hypothetical protein